MDNELQRIFALAEALKQCSCDEERLNILDKDPRVMQWTNWQQVDDKERELVIKSLIAIGQEDLLDVLLEELFPVESFYKEIGGIVGYHWTMFSHLHHLNHSSDPQFFHRPPGIDISFADKSVMSSIL